MNVKTSDGRVYVSLSHRNLKDLLDALELGSGAPAVLSRLLEDGRILTVQGQWDKEHYSGRREAGPGINYPSAKKVEDML